MEAAKIIIGAWARTLLVAVAFCVIFTSQVLGQTDIAGPGVPPVQPIELGVTAGGFDVSLNYVFTNNSAVIITDLPQIQCPPQSVNIEFNNASFTLAPGESRAIMLEISDLPDGAEAGDTVVCTINNELLIINLVDAPLIVEIPGLQSSLVITDLALLNSITMLNRTTASELSLFDFDYEVNFVLDASIESLSVKTDIGFGITGHEFSVLSLSASLGVLDISHEIAFGTPFDTASNVLLGGPNVFVTNRVSGELNFAGVEISSLFIYENTKFTNPFLNAADAFDAIQTPNYQFGAVFEVEGETPSGIELSGVAAFCADPSQVTLIKKRSFFTSACETGPDFTFESISISNIPVSVFRISRDMEFRPNQPISERWTVRFLLLDNISVTSRFSFNGLFASGGFSGANFTLIQDSFNVAILVSAGFTISQIGISITLPLDPASLSFSSTITPGTGLSSAGLTLIVPLGGVSNLVSSFSFSTVAPNELQFQNASFIFSADLGLVSFRSQALFNISGLQLARFDINIGF